MFVVVVWPRGVKEMGQDERGAVSGIVVVKERGRLAGVNL